MNDENRSPQEVALEPELARELCRLSEQGRETQRDLWPGIRSELGPSATATQSTPSSTPHSMLQRSTAWWVRAAAALLLGIGLTAITLLVTSRPATSGIELTDRVPTAADLPAGAPSELQAAFADYLDERRKLLQRLTKSLEPYPLQVHREIRANIEVIEGAIQEIESSIAKIENHAEEMRLASLYQRELRFLRGVDARLQGSAAVPAWRADGPSPQTEARGSARRSFACRR